MVYFKISKFWAWTSFIVFLYFLFFCWIFPIYAHDDWLYRFQGNPFYLQYLEYLVWHGRFVTHTLLRLTLQAGDFVIYPVKALFIMLLFTLGVHQYNPYFWRNTSIRNTFSVILFIFCCLLFSITLFTMFFYTSIAVLFSNYLSAIFILWFFSYYIKLLDPCIGSCNLIIFLLSAFLAGSSHELAGAVLPMLVIMAVILKLKKINTPTWYWLGAFVFFLGYLVILLSPGNDIRIDPKNFPQNLVWIKNISGVTHSDTSYGHVHSWYWFGEYINWQDLGVKRYLYSFIKHLLGARAEFWVSPGWLPSTWYIHILFFLFIGLIYKKEKNWLSNLFLIPMVYYIFSWGLVGIMIFSPMFRIDTVEFVRFFILIALASSIYYVSIIYKISNKFYSALSIILLSTVLIGQSVQVPALYQSRVWYMQIESKIKQASQDGRDVVEISENSRAVTLWGHTIANFSISGPMLQYYGIKEVKIREE